MTRDIETYFLEGCGRCPLGGTPGCKVHDWQAEMEALRRIILATELEENIKWGVPCYTFQQKNVLILSALRDCCALSFFKGALLQDEKEILVKPGTYSQADRRLTFTSMEEVQGAQADIMAYIEEAIAIERSGRKVDFQQNPEPYPEELEEKLAEDLLFKNAFEALTPGRQRGYVIYFSAPKQSGTRRSRIEKSVGKILNGEGLHDKYKKK